MKRINDLENQLNKKGASLTEKRAGKVLADDMLTHVSGGGREGWIKVTWTLRF